jgi:periplasmic protein TonB
MAVAPVPEERSGFLRNCLVEGDSAQEARVRRNKERALLTSIVVQILIVAALVIFPLFTKGENIAGRVVVIPPIPYSSGGHTHPTTPAHPPRGNQNACRFCAPPSIPPTITMHDPSPVGDITGPDGPEIPGVPEGPSIPGVLPSTDSRQGPPPPLTHPHAVAPVRMSEPVIAAKLVHRVEPTYPPLGIQLRREGRVELHAIISTDGSIQSLEVITGDPLFIKSALAAVREWRYQPTILDGQPVEIDTHITVIYTLSH